MTAVRNTQLTSLINKNMFLFFLANHFPMETCTKKCGSILPTQVKENKL